jgi:hypothetical protein
MITNAAKDSYRVHLSKTFLYKEVLEKIDPYITVKEMFFYENIVDYINATITEVKVPGLVGPVTNAQTLNAGSGQYKFQGQNPFKEKISKSITLSFSMKEARLNWVIMYMNLLHHLEQNEEEFLSPIYLEVMNIAGQVIFKMEFRQIFLERMDDLSLSTAGGFNTDKFTINFGYNEYDIEFVNNKDVRDIDPEKYSY